MKHKLIRSFAELRIGAYYKTSHYNGGAILRVYKFLDKRNTVACLSVWEYRGFSYFTSLSRREFETKKLAVTELPKHEAEAIIALESL